VEVLAEATGLGKSYGEVRALVELDFALRAGEVVGLLGPNGAGKTTTLKLLLGLLRPTTGAAHILGRDCTSESKEAKALLGYSPDEPAFHAFLTGQETIDFVLSVRGLDDAEHAARAAALVEALEFGPQLDVLTHNYSHGMKKKLALILALLHRPRVLLLDEPTNGLDPPTAHRVRELLAKEAQAGAAVLVSTHLLDMADRLCGRVLLLHRGRLIFSGSPAEARTRAALEPDATLEDAFLQLVA
jgi:ABC-2 type transport system ATP-binding protein